MHLDQISSTKVRFDPFILVTIILFSSALRHSLYFYLPYCLSALGLEPALRGPSPQLNTKLLYYIFYCGILYLFYCFNFDGMAGAAVCCHSEHLQSYIVPQYLVLTAHCKLPLN